jgi:hypothetical protein
MQSTPVVLKGPRPWAFTKAELTAGLRRQLGDSSLVITDLVETSLKSVHPSVGRIRGVKVFYYSACGKESIRLVVKEPHTSTRTGTAGAGRREAAFYTTLAGQVPLHSPRLWAADKAGRWLALELLVPLREAEDWRKEDYLLAADKLVQLHDRFWGLNEDLLAYPWLSRQLTGEKQIYIKAASNSIRRMMKSQAPSRLSRDKGLAADLDRLVANGEKIASKLLEKPATFLHGDYWPGNLCLTGEGSLAAFDWQHTGVGSGVLDLVSLVQNSLWWFDPLPCEQEEIKDRYRSSVARINDCIWTDLDWEEQWDYGLMWKFLSEWMPLLSEMPEPVLNTSFQLVEEIWLEPLRKAIKTRL